ncbi:MAG: metal ABC transporter permease [Planctomycetota bacterium]
MRTIEYLTDPALGPLYYPGLVTAVLVALLCAPLSVLVVLKRLAFVGQGVSHAAFGGVGVAVLVAATTGAGLFGPVGQAVVGASCVGSALMIWWLSHRDRSDGGRTTRHADTAIGLVLAGSMALGLVLHRKAGELAADAGRQAPPSLESVLFGSVWEAGWPSAVAAAVLLVAVLGGLVWWRRPLIFWAFDDAAAEAAGVPTGRMRLVLLVLLALAVLAAVRLAGVVLATAMLILPGMTALELSRRLWPVVVAGFGLALASVLLGLVLSFEAEIATGPAVVFVQIGMYAVVRGVRAVRGASGSAASGAG